MAKPVAFAVDKYTQTQPNQTTQVLHFIRVHISESVKEGSINFIAFHGYTA